MSEAKSESEIAHLMRTITENYEAARNGLTGLAYGTAQHKFITKRMENIGQCQQALKKLVGEQEAIKLTAQALEQAQNEQKEDKLS